MSGQDKEILIPVIRIVNPFNPREHVRETLPWEPAKTLADYFPLGSVEHIVSINGKVIAADQFAVTHLGPEDNLVMCPIPQGGGGKGILRIVAMIAVAIAAPYAAATLAPTLGITGAMGVAALTAGISIAGSVLVNALLPPPKPTSNARNDLSSSPTYGIDGAKNTSTEMIPVPVSYGAFRQAGNIVGMYVENVGDTQMLYMLINAGEGEIAGITDVELNDNPISDYTNVEVAIRTGSPDQAIIPWFADTISPVSKNLRLTPNWSYHSTVHSIDKFRLDFVAPQGLFGVNTSDGSSYGVSVDIEAQYSPAGQNNWQPIPAFNDVVGWRGVYAKSAPPPDAFIDYGDYSAARYYIKDASGNIVPAPMVYTWFYSDNNQQVVNPNDLAYINNHVTPSGGIFLTIGAQNRFVIPVYGPVLRISDNRRSAVRRSFYSAQIPNGKYDIRVRRKTPYSTSDTLVDDVYWSDANEIVLDDVCYTNTALVAIKIQLTDQLSGVPKVTYLNQGKLIKTYGNLPWGGVGWMMKASSNPAWVTWDMLTNKRYGAGMSESRLSLSDWKAWADYCDQKGLTFNGVIDSEMSVWDATQYPLRCGHSQLVNVGTRFTVATEKPSDPVMMFSVANIIEGTFKETWLGTADRANDIEVTYYDKDDKYKRHTVKVYDPAQLSAGRRQKTASITMIGVTDRVRAYKEGLMQLNINRYVLQTVEFGAPIDAIACTVGDLIYVQHDMPQWGFAGRFEAGCTTTQLMLDREVTLEADKQYRVLAHVDALQRASGTVTNVAGTSVFLTGFNGASAVKRLQCAGLERRVTGVFNQGDGSYGVTLDDVSGVTVGMVYSLWDTDVLLERDVVNIPGVTTTVLLQTPMDVAPAQFSDWMFGEVTKYKKPFRVKAINGSHEYRRDITAIEYNASVYDLDGVAVPTPDYSNLKKGVDQVTIDSVTEDLFRSGNLFRTHVTVNFSSAQETYANSIVYAAVNGGPFTKIADTAFDRATIDLDDDDVVVFQVVARDVLGMTAAASGAPTVTHTVVGKAMPPADVKSFTATKRASDILLKWAANTDIDLAGYELRIGPSWDAGTVLTANLAGTSFSDHQTKAGTYYYHIRAIDTSGNYSANVTTVQLDLKAPARVNNFNCIQSQTRLEFRWDANPEQNIVGYEIREGQSWTTSQLIVTTQATTYSTPAGSAGSRLFWIKAIASPGIYSDTPEFVSTDVAQTSNRNVIFTDDEVAAGYPGVKHGAIVDGGFLTMSPDVARSEYLFNVDLQDTFRAQNSMFAAVDAVAPDTVTWATAKFAWSDSAAKRQWTPNGNLDSVRSRYQIAPYVGLQGTETDGWRFDDTTGSVKLNFPTQAAGVTYAPGRYGNGISLQDTTFVGYSVNIGPTFSQSFWIVPQLVTDAVYMTLQGAGGARLSVGYSTRKGGFYLEDQLANRIDVPFKFAVGDKLCVCVVQNATARRLFVGSMDNKNVNYMEKLLSPIGSFTTMNLY